jgi:caffeoyl-CoA O-methyltransferase
VIKERLWTRDFMALVLANGFLFAGFHFLLPTITLYAASLGATGGEIGLIGGIFGYSAICMAKGLDKGGELHTIEIDDELEDIAAKYFREAEVQMDGRIVQHIGSALDIAPTLGKFDLIFIDGDKREYPQYYRMVMEMAVHSGSYILADNILWYGKVTEPTPANDRFTEGIKEFNRMVVEDDRVENVILPLRDGLNLIRVK